MNIKKTKTTYGVYNLIEWHALLRLGKASVKVHFSGGSITTQGVTPATFTTADPVIQFAIERSPEFRNGKIKVVRRSPLNEVVEIECNFPKTINSDTSPNPAPIPTETQAAPVVEIGDAPDPEADNEAAGEDNANTARPLTQVEFSCNDDAKDYLEQNFGLVRSKLRKREDICSAAKAYGVEIIFV
ncbi:MAG: hypothetical protein K2M41_02200 [Muribaculaceae bacterium]|nr:hypothetical protein [Muribaculaceae bacterium]